MKITDKACLEALRWMRKWDYDLNRDVEFLSLKLGCTDLTASVVISRGREIEQRKINRGVCHVDGR